MKLKGLTKLVLAGTALAATAATLTTSTYAWYVTNSTAKVNGVEGAVKSESSGSLYVAKNKVVSDADQPQNYQRSISLIQAVEVSNAFDVSNGQFLAQELEPQSKVAKTTESGTDYYYYVTSDETKGTGPYYTKTSGGNFEAFSGDAFAANTKYYERSTSQVWVDADGKATTGKFITFKYWLKANSTGNATVKFKVDNVTAQADVVTQVALQLENIPTGLAKDDVFAVDAVNALRMSVKTTEYSTDKVYEAATGTAQSGVTYYSDANGTVASPQPAANADVSTGYWVAKQTYTAGSPTTVDYKVKEIALDAAGQNAYATNSSTAVATNGIAFAAGGDANLYYYGILNEYPWNTTDAGSETVSTGTTSWAQVALTADVDTLLEFNIWLEGSDADCWDSCRGQSFTFDFEFTM